MKTQQQNTRKAFRNTAFGAIFVASIATTMPAHAGWFSHAREKVHHTVSQVKATPGNIQNKVEDISRKLNELFQKVENSQPLADHLRNGPLMKMITETLGYMSDMKGQYQQFTDSGEDEAFRQDIKQILSDMSAISQKFGPSERKQRRLNKMQDLMDKIPGTLLFVMHEAAGDRIQTMEDRIGRLSDRLNQLPELPPMSELTRDPESYTNQICPLVNDKPTKITVALVKVAIKDVSFVVGHVKKAIPEDIDINVDVVAGGGTTIKNPAQRVLNAVANVLDLVQLKIDNYETIAGAVCPSGN